MGRTASRQFRAALRRSFLFLLLAGALAFVPALFDTGTRAQSSKLAPTNTGAFSGTVTDAVTSAPIANMTVLIHNSFGSVIASVTTNDSGNYVTPPLSEGTYFARTFDSLDYMDELYDNIECEDGCAITNGTPITVTVGATTTGIDFALAKGGRISGRITDEATGQPLSNISVRILNPTISLILSATTDSSGNYIVEELLPPGTYYVGTSTSSIYINEAYDNIPCQDCDLTRSTPITVTAGATTTGIDFALTAGGVIEGTITNAVTGAPILNAVVLIFSSDGRSGFGAFPNNSGVYKSREGLPTGTYYVLTETLGFVNKLYNNFTCAPCDERTGTPVFVTAGSTTSGINFALTQGGRISGRITNAATSAPLTGVTVRIYNSLGELVTSINSNSAGTYTTGSVLPTGTYYARTASSQGLLTQAYSGIDCTACTPTLGAPIAVTAGSTTTGVDFALTAGGRISGTVTDADTGAPLSEALVQIFAPGGGVIVSVRTNSIGFYTSQVGLATGRYYVASLRPGGYEGQVYSNIACAPCDVTTGIPVSVTAGSITTGINFALRKRGRISGTITDAATSAPLANVLVEILNSSGDQLSGGITNISGNYTTLAELPSGTYYARTFNTPGYVDELYNNIECAGCVVTSGTPITVTAGSTTTGINFTLAAGGRISGAVTDSATSLPVGGVTVEIYNSSGILVTSVLTDASGNYTTRAAMPTGSYYVRAINNVGYLTELYNNVTCLECDVTTGTPVSVTAGATTTGINFALDAGGRIFGAVNDISDLTPIFRASIEFYNSSGTPVGTAVSNVLGNYTSPALPAGTYFARTTNARGFADKLYNNIPCAGCAVTTGDPITVSVGSVTSGINFALCSYLLSPGRILFSGRGGEGSIDVTAQGTCVWTATSNDAWIEIISIEGGPGSGKITYLVRENFGSDSRTGTITVGTRTFTINQSGTGSCSYNISPTTLRFERAGGEGSTSLSTGAACAWQAASNANWLIITSAATGVGNATINFVVLENTTGSSRAGVITVAGRKLSVKQK